MAAKSSAGARILAREEVRVLGIPNLAGAAAPPRPNIDSPLDKYFSLKRSYDQIKGSKAHVLSHHKYMARLESI
jgi:hypothetical protein